MIIEFTLEFSRQEPEAFVREVLYEKLHPSELVLGVNFRFGRGRAGELQTLRSFGSKFDFEVRRVEPVLDGDEIISSSRIRRALADGTVTAAAAMLGRSYFLDGKVVKGDGRGKGLGFATANLALEGDLLVADGVYATSARLGGRVHQGMSHVGRRPTFGIERRSVETHLFDFAEEVYGAPIRLFFHERLRETIAFDGPEALKRQLAQDKKMPGASSVASVATLCYKTEVYSSDETEFRGGGASQCLI